MEEEGAGEAEEEAREDERTAPLAVSWAYAAAAACHIYEYHEGTAATYITHRIYTSHLGSFLGFFLFRLLSSSIKISDESLFVADMLKTCFMLSSRLKEGKMSLCANSRCCSDGLSLTYRSVISDPNVTVLAPVLLF